MPLSLTTFASGAVIDATVLRARIAAIEDYVNEGSVAGDRAAGWVTPTHIYRPDFFGAPNPHSRFSTGESIFRTKTADDRFRYMTSYVADSGSWLPVPGLQGSFALTETLSAGTTYYRLVVHASFYVYELGGGTYTAYPLDEESRNAADVALSLNGTAFGSSRQNIYSSSLMSSGQFFSAYYPRKQVGMIHGWAGNVDSLAVGVNHFGVVVQNNVPAAEGWKHIIFQQGNLLARYWLR